MSLKAFFNISGNASRESLHSIQNKTYSSVAMGKKTRPERQKIFKELIEKKSGKRAFE